MADTGRGRGNNNRGRKGKRGPGRGSRDHETAWVCRRCGATGHYEDNCFASEAECKRTLQTTSDVTGRLANPAHSVPFVDTHCHLDYICEDARCPTWSDFCAKNPMPSTYAGAITTLCDSTALLSSMMSQLDDLTANHPNVFFTFGMHPHNSKYWNERIEARVAELVATHPRCLGWGEIGLDATSIKKGGSDMETQTMCFVKQLELAAALCPDKAVQVHFRGDVTVLLAVMLSSCPPHTKLHMHCWSVTDVDATMNLAKEFPNMCFGFTGMVCGDGKQAVAMRPVLKALPLSRILLETDGPYMLPPPLKPAPHSGQFRPTCNPAFVPVVAKAIADVKRISIDAVLREAVRTTARVYGVAPAPTPEECGLTPSGSNRPAPVPPTKSAKSVPANRNSASTSSNVEAVVSGQEKTEATPVDASKQDEEAAAGTTAPAPASALEKKNEGTTDDETAAAQSDALQELIDEPTATEAQAEGVAGCDDAPAATPAAPAPHADDDDDHDECACGREPTAASAKVFSTAVPVPPPVAVKPSPSSSATAVPAGRTWVLQKVDPALFPPTSRA